MTISPTDTRFSVVKTNKSGLQNTSVTNGSVYFVADTKELFFDFDSQRVKVTDILILNTEEERTGILFSPLNKFYFVLATQKLYLYKDGTWYPVAGSGGGSIDVDDVLSLTSENPVQNKIITAALNTKQDTNNLVTSISASSTDSTYPSAKCVFDAIADAEYDIDVISDTGGDVIIDGSTDMVPSKFIPKDTTITVATDGTGDFTKLSDAINYLTGKYSNGKVNIHIVAGTYSGDSQFVIDGSNFNIPYLYIYGDGITETILNCSVTGVQYMCIVQNSILEFSGIKFNNTNGTRVGRGVIAALNAKVTVTNCHTNNVDAFAFGGSQGGEIYLHTSITVTNCNATLAAEQNATIKTSWGCTINATNIHTLFFANSGSIYGSYPVYNTQNVTAMYNQTNPSITNTGIIAVTVS